MRCTRLQRPGQRGIPASGTRRETACLAACNRPRLGRVRGRLGTCSFRQAASSASSELSGLRSGPSPSALQASTPRSASSESLVTSPAITSSTSASLTWSLDRAGPDTRFQVGKKAGALRLEEFQQFGGGRRQGSSSSSASSASGARNRCPSPRKRKRTRARRGSLPPEPAQTSSPCRHSASSSPGSKAASRWGSRSLSHTTPGAGTPRICCIRRTSAPGPSSRSAGCRCCHRARKSA